MFFLDVFPERLVASLLVHVVHILRTSLENIFACFSGIFGFYLETANHAFNLISQSRSPTYSKLPSVAGEACLSLAVLLVTFAWHSAAQLLTKPSSSSLSHRHRDPGSSQLLLANILESLGKQTPRGWWNDENAFPDLRASLLPPVPALTFFLSFSPSFLFLKPSRPVQRSLTLRHFM